MKIATILGSMMAVFCMSAAAPSAGEGQIAMSKCTKDHDKKDGDCSYSADNQEGAAKKSDAARHRKSAAHKAVYGR